MNRRDARLAGWIIAALLVVSLLAACGSLIAPAQFFFILAVGWIKFLVRVVPSVSVDWPNVGLALVVLLLFFAGLHVLLRSLWRAKAASGAPGWPVRRSLAATVLIVTLFVAGLSMIGMTHQAVWMFSDREPMLTSDFIAHHRSSSSNNLHQIAIAVHNYADVYKSFPPSGTPGERGRMMHGWHTLLLPFTGDFASSWAWSNIRLDEPWNSETNSPQFKNEVATFLVPSGRPLDTRDEEGFAVSHYTGNVLVLGGDKSLHFQDIKDGTSNTILSGEAVSNPKAWGFPAHWRDPRLGINNSPDGFGSPWPGGAQFNFADASTRFLSDKIDPRVLEALTTPDGGEKIEPEL